MPWWQIVLWILVIAILTAGLYAWGLKKSVNQKQNLLAKLNQKASDKVLQYLKKNDTITLNEMTRLTKDIQVGEFHSKNRAIVSKPNDFSKELARKMIERGFLEEVTLNGKKCYRSRSKKQTNNLS